MFFFFNFLLSRISYECIHILTIYIKIYYNVIVAICSNHFDTDCFIMVWTKPRLKNVPSREMQRLKKDSIPTKMLILEKKKRMPESKKNMKRNKERNVP